MRFLIAIFLAVFLWPVASGQMVPAPRREPEPRTFEIKIEGVPESEKKRLNATYGEGPDGMIWMWKIGKVQADGKSYEKIARAIEEAYRGAKIYDNPRFKVRGSPPSDLEQKYYFTIGGEVRSGGQKRWWKGLTLGDALELSGGVTPSADLDNVTVYRNDGAYSYDLGQEKNRKLKLLNKDVIEVTSLKKKEAPEKIK